MLLSSIFMLSYEIVLNSLDWLSLVMVDIHNVRKFPNIGNMARIDREREDMEDSAKMAAQGCRARTHIPSGTAALLTCTHLTRSVTKHIE